MVPPRDDQAASAAGELTETLPTRRVAFGKQLDILRAYGALGSGARIVTIQGVADVVGLKPDTAALTNSFFLASGLIDRAESGGMRVASEVLAFQRAYQWAPDTAGHELAAAFEDAWYWQALAGHLALGPITEAKAMAILGQASNATKHRAVELRLIVEFLEVAGLVERHDGHIRAPTKKAPPKPEERPPSPDTPASRATVPAQTGELPLLIQGLLEQLPGEGKWKRSQMESWLKMARLSLEVAYDIENDATRTAEGGGQPEG